MFPVEDGVYLDGADTIINNEEKQYDTVVLLVADAKNKWGINPAVSSRRLQLANKSWLRKSTCLKFQQGLKITPEIPQH